MPHLMGLLGLESSRRSRSREAWRGWVLRRVSFASNGSCLQGRRAQFPLSAGWLLPGSGVEEPLSPEEASFTGKERRSGTSRDWVKREWVGSECSLGFGVMKMIWNEIEVMVVPHYE